MWGIRGRAARLRRLSIKYMIQTIRTMGDKELPDLVRSPTWRPGPGPPNHGYDVPADESWDPECHICRSEDRVCVYCRMDGVDGNT